MTSREKAIADEVQREKGGADKKFEEISALRFTLLFGLGKILVIIYMSNLCLNQLTTIYPISRGYNFWKC